MERAIGAIKWLLHPVPLLVVQSVLLAVAVTALSYHSPIYLGTDSHVYLELGSNIAHGKGMTIHGTPTAVVTPGYPLLVAAAYAMGVGHVRQVVALLQAVMLAATAFLCGSLGESLGFDRKARILTQLGVGFYPPFVLRAAQVMTEIPFLLLVVLVAWLFARALQAYVAQQRAVGLLLLAAVAVVVAGAVAFRPTGALLPVAFVVVIVVVSIMRRAGRSRASWAVAAAAILGLALFVGVWTVRNESRLHAFVPLSTEGPWVAYEGNLISAQGQATPAQVSAALGTELWQKIQSMNEVKQQAEFQTLLFAYIRAHPRGVIDLWPQKALRFWFNLGYPRPPSKASLAIAVTNALILIAAAIGAYRLLATRRDSRPMTATLLVFMALLFATHVLTFANVRYAYPDLALAIMFASGGVVFLYHKLRHGGQTRDAIAQ